jgi:two-component system CheB/CheR fusion protein
MTTHDPTVYASESEEAGGENKTDYSQPGPTCVVGIGASAGGHEPLEQIFTHLPDTTGLAFVVVMHLAAEGPAYLVDLLRCFTTMPVCTAEEGMEVRANTVYTTCPGHHLALYDGVLRLEAWDEESGAHQAIDHFLGSLADDQGESAVAVILSGLGNDGRLGVQRIKACGGLVLVQDPGTALHTSMPAQAVATGMADLILPAEAMVDRLQALAQSGTESAAQPGLNSFPDEELQHLFSLLKSRTGHDFSAYKRNTVLRRIDRRMMVNEVQRFRDYLTLLEDNPSESEALYRELLIGVTGFFRDPEAFERLRADVIPSLCANRGEDEPLRIWHACCATGEEAYSVAMLLQEYLEEHQLQTRIQIFATDLDEAAINRARAGIYPPAAVVGMSATRLRRFFTRSNENWLVDRQLREMIVFAHHNIIKDPPFSRLDLLVCRNFLIYLNPEMQKRLMALFHQILNPGGVLFLGSAESVGLQSNLFTPVDQKWKIFTRQNGEQRLDLPFPFFGPIRRINGVGSSTRQAEPQPHTPTALADRVLMERYVPARIIVNEHNEVIHFSKQAGAYLVMPEGEPTRDAIRLVREELRPALRAVIYKTCTEQKENVFQGIKVVTTEGEVTINLIGLPLKNSTQGDKLVVVVFEPAPLPQMTYLAVNESTIIGEDCRDSVVRHLEEQLRVTSEQLQATCEQLESSNEGFLLANEELMATNEELQSANEELQATNEELETSKEELQALNEELITVNAELQSKIEELDRINSDLENLFASAEIATIFLDRKLNIKRFSPAMATLFGLIPGDIGRPFRHLSAIADWVELPGDAARVMQTGVPEEREVAFADEEGSYLMRLLPYHANGDRVDGIVILLIDITQHKQMRTALKEHATTLKLFIEQAPASLAMFDRNMRYLQVSRRWLNDYGLGKRDILGRSHYEIFPEISDDWKKAHQRGLEGEILRSEADLFVRADGSHQWIRWEVRPWVDGDDRIGGIVIFTEDITGIKQAEEALRRYELLAAHSRDIILFVEHEEGRLIEANAAACEAYGYTRDELLRMTIHELRGPDAYLLTREQMAQANAQGILFETCHRRKDGTVFPVEANSKGAEIGNQRLLLSVIRDITERKQTEQELLQANEMRRLAMEAAGLGAWEHKLSADEVHWNEQCYRLYGLSPKPECGVSYRKILEMIHPDDRDEFIATVQQALAGEGGGIFECEHRILRPEGGEHWLHTHGQVYFEGEGPAHRPVRFIGVNRDITSEKQAEQALRASEHRLRLALEATSEGLWDWDMATGCVYRSSRYFELVNRIPEEDSGDFAFFICSVHPEDLDRVLAVIETHKQGLSESISIDFRLHPDCCSLTRWLRIKGKAVERDEHGRPLRMVGTLADVTRLKQQQENLRLSEQRRKMALAAAQAGTWEWDLTTNDHIWSDELWPLYGLEPHQCRSCYEEWLKIIHPDDRSTVEQMLKHAIEHGEPFRLEWRVRPGERTTRWLMSRGRPIFDQDFKLIRYLGIAMDITERKENEAARSRLEAHLQQAQKMEAIGTLAGGIAHDFNNILAAILGYTEMARDSQTAGSDVVRNLDKVLEAAGRAADLVRQILAFSRQSHTEPAVLEPIHLVKEAIKLLRPALPSTITIRPVFHGGTRSILADPTQLHQVVMNLCTNAFHAMEATGGLLDISLVDCTLSADELRHYPRVQAGHFVRLSIGDNGPGIGPEIMEKIFDPYFTTKEVGRGTGLGLAIVHSVATAAGGFVSCESTVGEGTVFHVFFPAIAPDHPRAARPMETVCKGRERILLVDDEQMLAEMEQTMLERLGYRVTVCSDSLMALSLFQEAPEQFDAVITDQTMPGMTGIDLARRMLALRPGLPIILCTGYSSLVNEQQARAHGIRGFALKPLTNRALAQLLRQVLDET